MPSVIQDGRGEYVNTGFRFFGLDALRHLLALAVIIQHTWSASRYSEGMYPHYLLLTDLVDGAVFGFFLIAGFLAKPRNDISVYTKSRAWRLFMPFALFSMLYAIAGVILGQERPIDYLIRFFTLNGSSAQLYFLPYLFLIDLIGVVLLRLTGCRGSWLLPAALTAAVGVALLLPTASSTGPGLSLSIFYLVAYLAGAVSARTRGAFALLPLGAGAFALGLALDPRFLDASAMLFLCYAALRLSHRIKRPLPGSGAVYLLHTPIINFSISTFLYRAGIIEWSNFILTVTLTYILCLIVMNLTIYYIPKSRNLLLE